MLLQSMAFARDVNRDFFTIRKSHTRNLTECGVRLLRRHGSNLQAYAPLLRTLVQYRGFTKLALFLAVLFDKLVNGWHLRLSF